MMDHVSLFELQEKVKKAMYESFPFPIWISAEIGEMKVNYAGHCYLELVEKDSADNLKVVSKASANIWASKFKLLKAFFESTAKVKFDEGLKVLIKVDVRYHEVYGLSLNIVDIDPSFTVGEMRIQRNLIIQQLMDEGIIDLNKELEVPQVPQRIAVVSSGNAAGYQDFINHLERNSYGYKYYTTLFPTVMQGNEAEVSLVASLDAIYARQNEFDVVAIIRGGGSQVDLSCFDSYLIAANIAQFPLPVLSGIGHDKDESVADIVSCLSFKTPTAVAAYLIDMLVEFEADLNFHAREVASLASGAISQEKVQAVELQYAILRNVKDSLSRNRSMVESLGYQIANQVGGRLNSGYAFLRNVTQGIRSELLLKMQHHTNMVDGVFSGVSFRAAKHLEQHRYEVESIEKRLNSANPTELMKKGYSLTICDGKVAKSVVGLEGKLVETILSDGKLHSRVENVEKTK